MRILSIHIITKREGQEAAEGDGRERRGEGEEDGQRALQPPGDFEPKREEEEFGVGRWNSASCDTFVARCVSTTTTHTESTTVSRKPSDGTRT